MRGEMQAESRVLPDPDRPEEQEYIRVVPPAGLEAEREGRIEWILRKGIIAIVRGLAPDCMRALADALYEGGVEIMEVTFDQSDAGKHAQTERAIGELSAHCGGRMLIGAGTVTSPELVDRARAAGAKFIVSPDVNPEVIRRTRALGMVSIPGALTPSEVLEANEAGADFVKLFPAGQLGGDYIRALRGPINHVRLMAVGGVDENNIGEFIRAGCVGAGVGGSLIRKDWIRGGEYGRIAELAGRYVANLKSVQ